MLARLVVGLGVSTAAALAYGQAYPTKPITVIVPFAAGGPGDALMRSFAMSLAKNLKQSLLIENAGGASGNVGAARAARAAPDGYTLLYHNIGFVTAPGLYKKLDFNPLTDYEYIGMMSTSPNILVGRIDLPAGNLKELVGFLKTNQTKVAIGDAGIGGPAGLCSILLASHTGTKPTMVSYKGTAPAMIDLLGKQIDLLCDGAATATTQIRAGKVKVFGISGMRRLATLPDIPTLDEQGMTGFDMVVWNAMYAPKNTPRPVMSRLSEAFHVAIADTDFSNYLEKVGSQPVPMELATPAGLQGYVKSEVEKWTALLRAAGAPQE
ncbi:MAG: tripartite tricarboxylate transporter substrate-binding protein [Burkholderiales bacterium]